MSRYTQYFGKNNVSSKLAVGISSIATTIQVEEGEGELWGSQFPILGTIEHRDSTGKCTKREIVKVESKSSDTFTVVRKFAPCPPSDDSNSQVQVSDSFDPGDSFSIYIPYEILNAVSESINDLYNNGNDRLFLKKTSGLGFEITPGNVRFETGEAYYPGGTGTVVDNSMNYVMLDSSFNISVETTELFDVQKISIAEVKAVNGEITEITTRKIDGIAGRMGGGGDPVYGDGSDGDLVISENTILNAGQQYQFSNLTICPGVVVSFSGGGGAKIKVANCFVNEGVIDMTNLDVDNHQYIDSTSFCTIQNCGFFNENAGKGGYSGFLDCPKTATCDETRTYDNTYCPSCNCCMIYRLSGAGGDGGGYCEPNACSGCGSTDGTHAGGYDGYMMGGGGAHGGCFGSGICNGCPADGNNGGNGGNGVYSPGYRIFTSGGGGGGGFYDGKGGDGGYGSGICYCVCYLLQSTNKLGYFNTYNRCHRMGGDGGNGGIIGNGGNGGCGGQSFAGGNGGDGICGGKGGDGGIGGVKFLQVGSSEDLWRTVGGNGGNGGNGYYGGDGGNGGKYCIKRGSTRGVCFGGACITGDGGKGGDGVVPGKGGNGGDMCKCSSSAFICCSGYCKLGNGGDGGNGLSPLTSLNIKAKCFCNAGCILSVGGVGGQGGDGGTIYCGDSYCMVRFIGGNGGNGGKGGSGGTVQIITNKVLERGTISVAGGVGGIGGCGGTNACGCSGTTGTDGSQGPSGDSGTLYFFMLEG